MSEPEMSRDQARRSESDDGFGRTIMWEAKAAAGCAEELLAYALDHADPAAQVYRSSDRVVVIDPTGTGLPDVPAELVARPPHAWPFERVR